MRTFARVALWVLVPLLCGGAAFLLRPRSVVDAGPPAIRVPGVVDLGTQDIGALAVGTVRVSNHGRGELVIEDIRTNCQCTGLEVNRDGTFERLTTLRLPPGGTAELSVRVSVSGPAGREFTNLIYFRTNDPSVPEHKLAVTVSLVTGGIRTNPSTVTFGTVPVGESAERDVEVLDHSVNPRRVVGVRSSSPDLVVLGVTEIDRGRALRPAAAGTPVATVRIRVTPKRSSSLDGQLLVEMEGDRRGPHAVPVTGRATDAVEATPDRLILPLATGDKAAEYRTSCLCRSACGEPLVLRVTSCPPGLEVAVEGVEGQTGAVRVGVTLKDQVTAGTVETKIVKLAGTAGTRSVTLEIPVLCRGK